MKNLPYSLILLASLLVFSCASYQSKKQTAAVTFPELGSIVVLKDHLWYNSANQLGTPKWNKPLTIQVQQLPFNKVSYGNYANYMAKASRINSIPYVDSLPYKPKYLRLDILDKIELVERLNDDQNKTVRSYLENDDDYKIVTSISVTTTDALMVRLVEAQSVTLEEVSPKKMQLVLTNDNKEYLIALSELEVFDYGYSSFCWGEDRYHNKRIKTLNLGNEKCPKGTSKKASKVVADKSYLKF